MRTIIAGSRSITSYEVVDQAIQKACTEHNITITEVVEGEAKGVDVLAKQWAINNGIPYKPFEAKWKDVTTTGARVKRGKYGPYNVLAGFWRKEDMAVYAASDHPVNGALIAVWDGQSTGTNDMVQRATNHNLIVAVVNVK